MEPNVFIAVFYCLCCRGYPAAHSTHDCICFDDIIHILSVEEFSEAAVCIFMLCIFVLLFCTVKQLVALI